MPKVADENRFEDGWGSKPSAPNLLLQKVSPLLYSFLRHGDHRRCSVQTDSVEVTHLRIDEDVFGLQKRNSCFLL